MKAHRNNLAKAVCFMLFANLMDYWSTILALRAGLTEANPLIAYMINEGYFNWVKLGVPLLVGAYVIARAYFSKGSVYNRWMVIALRGLAVFFLFISMSNFTLALIRL